MVIKKGYSFTKEQVEKNGYVRSCKVDSKGKREGGSVAVHGYIRRSSFALGTLWFLFEGG